MNKKNLLLKTSFWYTFSSFLSKGIVFIMIPFYVRLLTKSEYGSYSNLISWLNIVCAAIAMNLNFFVMKIQNTEPEKVFSYIINSFYASLALLIVTFIPVFIARDYLTRVLNLNNFDILIVFLYSGTVPFFYLYTGYLRSIFKLKEFVVANMLITVLTAGLSLVFLFTVSSEIKLVAFVIAQVGPIILYSLYYLFKSVKVDYKFNKEIFFICLKNGIPLIPHLLGIAILSKIDRVMLTSIIGEVATSDYSVAHNLSMIITTFSVALNSAFVPWMTKQLSETKYTVIKKPIYIQTVILAVITILVSLFAPEVVRVWAGAKYANIIYIIPPIMISVLMIHMYTLFYNVELYFGNKKTIVYSSIISAIFNIITNAIFIPKYGYEAAAYTTLASNLLLVVLHYLTVRSMNKLSIFPVKELTLILAAGLLSIVIVVVSYSNIYLRLSVVAISAIFSLLFAIKNKNMIKSLIKK